MAQHDKPGSALSAGEVRRIARLARLSLTGDQIERERERLTVVLDSMARLGELELDDVAPMSHPMDTASRLEADAEGPTLDADTVARLAPESDGPFIKVPKVLHDEAGGP